MAKGSVIFPVVVLLIFVLAIILTLPAPDTLVTAELRSETMTILVTSPDTAEFVLPVAYRDGESRCRHDEHVRPSVGDRVTYTRKIGEALIVHVDHAADPLAPTRSSYYYVKAQKTGRCRTSGILRLPIVGSMSVGIVSGLPGRPPLPILDGRLSVYGRAVGKILGMIPVPAPGKLYAAETITMLPGSQIERLDVLDESSASWRGFVDIDFEQHDGYERGMLIEAATNAQEVSVFAPVPRRDGTVADQISLTLAARLKGDPNITGAIAAATFLLLIISVALQFVATVRDAARDTSTPATAVIEGEI